MEEYSFRGISKTGFHSISTTKATTIPLVRHVLGSWCSGDNDISNCHDPSNYMTERDFMHLRHDTKDIKI